MSQPELLKRVVTLLEGLAIPYFVTGSMASSAMGEPRASHDIDIVVELQPAAVGSLCSAFPAPDFYLSRTAIEDAIRRRSMFNLLEISSGDKVDFWLHRGNAFDASRFARRQRRDYLGVPVWISSAEDAVLAKLSWAKQSGGSEKQMTDVRGICEVQWPLLDRQYIDHWAPQLEVAEEWHAIQLEFQS